jgi:phytoene dehydrogenase-like protein
VTDYDAVIVGGGHNGLAAAAYLARAGRSCLLLERLDTLGGAAVSERLFTGLDARLSSYSYLVSLLPARIVDELGLGVQLLARAVSSYTPDPRAAASRGLLVDASDPDATSASFRALSGGAREEIGWRRFYEMTRRLAAAVAPTLTEPLVSRDRMRALIDDEQAWQAIFERPLGEGVAAAFEDELVAGVVLTDGLIGTFADPDGEDLRQNRCFLYHVIGRGTGDWLVPRGGMGTVTAALAAAARRAGAQLRAGAEVLALAPERDQVEVRYEDGGGERSISAAHVLAAVAPVELRRLLGHESAPEDAPEGAQLKVNMLLTRLPRLRDRAVTAERAFAGTFHVNETSTRLREAYGEASAGALPSPVPCECYCHSLADPSILGEQLRRAGAQTLTVFALQTPARLFAQTDRSAARERALAATLESLQSVLDESLEDCLLRDADGRPCIQAHSTADLQEQLRMPGGHIFHRDLSWPFAEQPDEIGRWGVETDHPRVLLCGAGARRGGGVSAIAGRNAAMAVLGG